MAVLGSRDELEMIQFLVLHSRVVEHVREKMLIKLLYYTTVLSGRHD